MKRQFLIETDSEYQTRAVQQIKAMIDDMRRIIRLLDEDIAADEARVRVYDPTDIAYPWAAKAMSDRRANLKQTIASLEQRLPAQIEASI
ncbi:MAG: hypothetical protein BGP05_19080 [Rhizobiales bacterium 62-47]|jgi:hypothetical protein|nr:hypothetical protein [Hyphomicrobiales bacterium]OJY09867.1 MAG: hypothetical protein BGP05_19080 [Rhizobiales bacterium 62-47]